MGTVQTRLPRVAPAVACALLAACHALLPLDRPGPDRGPPDAGASDATVVDWRHEQVAADAAPADATPADAASDAAVDAALPADTGGLEGPTPPACAAGASAQPFWASTTMLVCVGQQPTVSPCTAEKLCNAAAGWHLCTSTEYVARGGKTLGYPSPAWIKGCVRSATAPNAPTDQICPSCAMTTAPDKPVSWDCTTLLGQVAGYLNMGLVTSASCARAGLNDPSTEARWAPSPTFKLGHAALCCL